MTSSALENFYYDLEENKLTKKIRIENRVKIIERKTKSCLNIPFNYYYLSDVHMLVGIHQASSKYFDYDFIDVQTMLTIPKSRRAYKALKRVLEGHGTEVGQYTPLDTRLWDFIKERRQRLMKNKRVKRDQYD